MIKTLTRGIIPREPEDDPSRGQTIEVIGEYYRNAQPGAEAVIRETYGRVLRFRYTRVNEVKGSFLYLAEPPPFGGPAFNLPSCTNSQSPMGHARLVMPSPEIAAFMAANPKGKRRGSLVVERKK